MCEGQILGMEAGMVGVGSVAGDEAVVEAGSRPVVEKGGILGYEWVGLWRRSVMVWLSLRRGVLLGMEIGGIGWMEVGGAEVWGGRGEGIVGKGAVGNSG